MAGGGDVVAKNIFYFPIVSSEIDRGQPVPLAPIVGGTERVLLVDDEQAIATMLSAMLERLGYQVEAVTSSVDALALFKAQPDSYDLVITDQTMPYLTGGELAIKADIPIILCTGFSASFTEELAKKIGIRAYLMKPVVIQELTEKIRSVLD